MLEEFDEIQCARKFLECIGVSNETEAIQGLPLRTFDLNPYLYYFPESRQPGRQLMNVILRKIKDEIDIADRSKICLLNMSGKLISFELSAPGGHLTQLIDE